MLRKLCLRLAVGLALVAGWAVATTLEKLTLEEMIQKSHLIVRGKVLDASAVQRGSLIYTVYRVQVSEKIKGECGSVVEVSVPGGTLGRLKQTITGTPKLETGADHVVFIWKGSTGVNHIIGLSQGLFDVRLNQAGEATLVRGAIDAQMVNSAGQSVAAPGAVTLSLKELESKVRSAGVAAQ